MKTAVDTNVLLDVFLPDPKFGEPSREALRKQFKDGALIVGEIVYSELSAFFESKNRLDEALGILGVAFISSHPAACFQAGEKWKQYRKSGGSRQRVLADFLIGAHAEIHADGLLTRDRGFYKRYFKDLKVIEPRFSKR